MTVLPTIGNPATKSTPRPTYVFRKGTEFTGANRSERRRRWKRRKGFTR